MKSGARDSRNFIFRSAKRDFDTLSFRSHRMQERRTETEDRCCFGSSLDRDSAVTFHLGGSLQRHTVSRALLSTTCRKCSFAYYREASSGHFLVGLTFPSASSPGKRRPLKRIASAIVKLASRPGWHRFLSSVGRRNRWL